MEAEEEWKEVGGCSRYKISSFGRVWDTLGDREMPLVENLTFLCVNLYKDGGGRTLARVHRLVAEHFVDNPTNLDKVMHKDGNKMNNHVSNIMWKPVKPKKERTRFDATYEYKGASYTVKELAELTGKSRDVIRGRIKYGWSIREIILDKRDFQGDGYATETHWHPTKKSLESWQREQRLTELVLAREEREKTRQEEAEARRAARETYLKYGVGNYVSTPISGMMECGRKATKGYSAWDAMLKRCYQKTSERYPKYGGRGVYVCDEWHDFQTYIIWYENQYKEDGWHVDKDILEEGNLEYSPTKCVFVPPCINAFFAFKQEIREDGLPTGVQLQGGVYRAAIKTEPPYEYFSSESVEEAYSWYRSKKMERIQQMVEEYSGRVDDRVISRLLDYKFLDI